MRRLAIGAGALALFVGGGSAAYLLTDSSSAAGSLNVHLVSQTSTKITLGWTPQLGLGYRFYRNGLPVSNTGDPARSQVTFSKALTYGVQVVLAGELGVYPPPVTTTTTTTTTTDTTTTTTTAPPPSLLSNYWIDNNGGSCARSATPVAYQNNGTECSQVINNSALDTAYHSPAMQCGDVVGIANGTSLPMQMISEVGALSNCSSDVIFQGDPANKPFISDVVTSYLPNWTNCNCGADHVTLRNIITTGVEVLDDTTFFTIDGIQGPVGGGATSAVRGASFDPNQITIKNSILGPCPVPSYPTYNASNHCSTTSDNDGKIEVFNAHNVTFLNDVIHDYRRLDSSPEHTECIALWDVESFILRNSRMYNCDTNALSMIGGDASGMTGTWYIENNWFGDSQAHVAINVKCGPPAGDIYIRFNSFSPGNILHDECGANTGRAGHYYITGNIFGWTSTFNYFEGCDLVGATYNYNIWLHAGANLAPCGGTGNVAIGTVPYVNGAADGSGDYHLTGSLGTADNYVPLSSPQSNLATDYDGQSRPMGAARDAGSDER